MSQLFDYFVCSRGEIEAWAAALVNGDDEAQDASRTRMALSVLFRNLGPEEVGLLAACAAGDDFDVVGAVDVVELVRAVSQEEGPWVMELRDSTVEAVAGLNVDEELIPRWVRHTADFQGGLEWRLKNILTAEAAETLKEMCALAMREGLHVYTCSYG